MAVDSGNSENKTNGQSANNDNTATRAPKYRTIVKRVQLARARTKGYKSPWCKPTRRRSKKMVFYIDAEGKEFPANRVEFDEEGNMKVKEPTVEKEEHTDEDEEEEEEEEDEDEEETEGTGEKSNEAQTSQTDTTDIVQVQHGPDPTKYQTVVRKVVVHRKGYANKSRSPWCRSTKRRYRNVVFYIDKQDREYEADSVTIDEHGNVKLKEQSQQNVTELSDEEQEHPDSEKQDNKQEAADSKKSNEPAEDDNETEKSSADIAKTSPRAPRSGSSPGQAAASKNPGSPRSLSPMSDHSYSTSPRTSRSHARESDTKTSEEKHEDNKDQQKNEMEKIPERRDRSPRDQRSRKVSGSKFKIDDGNVSLLNS